MINRDQQRAIVLALAFHADALKIVSRSSAIIYTVRNHLEQEIAALATLARRIESGQITLEDADDYAAFKRWQHDKAEGEVR